MRASDVKDPRDAARSELPNKPLERSGTDPGADTKRACAGRSAPSR